MPSVLDGRLCRQRSVSCAVIPVRPLAGGEASSADRPSPSIGHVFEPATPARKLFSRRVRLPGVVAGPCFFIGVVVVVRGGMRSVSSSAWQGVVSGWIPV